MPHQQLLSSAKLLLDRLTIRVRWSVRLKGSSIGSMLLLSTVRVSQCLQGLSPSSVACLGSVVFGCLVEVFIYFCCDLCCEHVRDCCFVVWMDEAISVSRAIDRSSILVKK
jgi:hypothetical protein